MVNSPEKIYVRKPNVNIRKSELIIVTDGNVEFFNQDQKLKLIQVLLNEHSIPSLVQLHQVISKKI